MYKKYIVEAGVIANVVRLSDLTSISDYKIASMLEFDKIKGFSNDDSRAEFSHTSSDGVGWNISVLTTDVEVVF